MAHGVKYKVKRRRRREGKTDYGKRLKLIKGRTDRLVVRISHRNVVAQIVRWAAEGDNTIVNTTALELKKYGWKGANGNVVAAYLTGFLCARKALKKGIKRAVLDIGLHTPVKGSNVFAVLKGAVDGGLEIPHDADVLPTEERIRGDLIAKYRNIEVNFEEVKKQIESKW